MSLWPILLRVFLSIALVFNGATTAIASAHMAHASTNVVAPQVDSTIATDTPSCNEHEPTTSAALADSPAAAADTLHSQFKHPSADCCKSDACRCACVQQAQAAVPTMAFTSAPIEHGVSVRPMSSGHATPALPHLIRPPIG